MLGNGTRRAFAIWAAICPVVGFGQAKPPAEFFVVCSSQGNLPTVYVSGISRGPATSVQGFRSEFAGFLLQRYTYKGVVSCAPAKEAAIAQNYSSLMATKLRNEKRNVVETGWADTAAASGVPVPAAATAKLQAVAPLASIPAAVQAASGAGGTAGAANAGGNGASGAAQITSILGSIFGSGGGGATGTGASGGSGASGAKSSGAKSAARPGGAAASPDGAGSGAAAGQSPFNQVSSALSNVFGSKSSGTAAAAAAPQKAALPDGALGAAQSQTTQLTVFGCGRQDSEVACVNDVTNQSQKDTLVQASEVWKETFIVDDRGDRHTRSKGFFLNIDGDQRQQMDIAYGKTARFILMFDDVPIRVQQVALRSTAGELDVEGIPLVTPGGTGH